MSSPFKISAGRAHPIGATFDGEGVNFAVFSRHATRVEICLFSDDGVQETHRIAMPERNGDIWHCHVAGLFPGQLYGLRAHGPYDPAKGQRFNSNKLLVDPYAKRLVGEIQWHPAVMGYQTGTKNGDLSFDSRDSARFVPKASVP